MSPSARKWKSCTRKIAHPTYASAHEHANRLNKLRPPGARKLKEYKCHEERSDLAPDAECHWHIGHPTSDPILRCNKRKRAKNRFTGKQRRFRAAA